MPLLLSRNMNGKIVLPLYRMKPPQESEQNRRQIRRARFLMVSFSMLMSVPIAYFGISLIELLYDPRYHMAGPIAVLFSLAILPQIIFNGYPDILLANGDSRRYFLLMAFTAALQLTFMFIGVTWWGIGGAILASPIAALLASLLRIRFIARYQANEIPMDLMFLAIGLTVNGWACWLHRAEILALLQ
jgi:O-antigen/teichoic acid export membrane protein